MNKRRQTVGLFFLLCCSVLLLAGSSAVVAQSSVITVRKPAKTGPFTIDFQFLQNIRSFHGRTCTVTVSIPGSSTPAQKANLISGAINGEPACGATATHMASSALAADVKVTATGEIVLCTKITDATGEEGAFRNKLPVPRPVPYRNIFKLEGTPSSGTVTVGDASGEMTVTTAGRTIQQICEELLRAFGKGKVTPDGFLLPRTAPGELSTTPKAKWEVTDPGLTITILHFVLISEIPTLTTWGLATLIAALLLLALWKLRLTPPAPTKYPG